MIKSLNNEIRNYCQIWYLSEWLRGKRSCEDIPFSQLDPQSRARYAWALLGPSIYHEDMIGYKKSGGLPIVV